MPLRGRPQTRVLAGAALAAVVVVFLLVVSDRKSVV